MMKKSKFIIKLSKRFSLLVVALCFLSCENEPEYIQTSGNVFGTTYSVQYFSEDENDYEKQFDSLFFVINQSMSTYQTDSDISKINKNEAVEVDEHFIKVFNKSKEIYRLTEGAFDPT